MTAPTREMVDAVYLALLGRQPESEATVDHYLEHSISHLLTAVKGSAEFQAREGSRSPLHHYNSSLNCEGIILEHARSGLAPEPGLCVNFLGTKIHPKFLPAILNDAVGKVEGVPIPANWHADIAEWAAALRAIDLAGRTFRMLELGCGWGCWMVNTGVAAKATGRTIRVIGVEADEGHIAFAKEACELNGFSSSEFAVSRGIVSAKPGMALFPRQSQPGENWGNKPVFDATPEEAAELQRSGRYDSLPNVPLSSLLGDGERLDLLHIDIQGGEADFVRSSMRELGERVNYMVIGTHSREIEGQLFESLVGRGWQLEIERPAILHVGPSPSAQIDGVQGWRNTREGSA